MLIYCSHCYGGKEENKIKAGKIIKQLQINDTENTYISPIHAFSYLRYNDIGYKREMELCLDLMIMCDEILVLSELSEGVKREIDLAIKCKMPVRYLKNKEVFAKL